MNIQSGLIRLALAVASLGVTCMNAQTVELFGGYSLANMKPERGLEREGLHGWNTSMTGYVSKRFGLTADFAGTYGTVSPTFTSSTGATATFTDVAVRQYSFMAGPQFRLFDNAHMSTSVKALFGAARGYVAEPGSVSTSYTYNPLDQTEFAALFGSNIDFKLNKRVSLRVSPGLYLTQFAGETQKNFRISFGPVFTFGGER